MIFAFELLLEFGNTFFKPVHAYFELLLQTKMLSVFFLCFLKRVLQIFIILLFNISISIAIYKVAR